DASFRMARHPGAITRRWAISQELLVVGNGCLSQKVCVQWLHSTESVLSGGAKMAGVKERPEHLPAAFADFDGAETMGRICGWVTGLFDFEVVRIADGHQSFFRHEEAERIDDPSLNAALAAFVVALAGPREE